MISRQDMMSARRIFIGWASRVNLTREQAAAEFDNNLTRNLVPMLEDFYVYRLRRTGVDFALNRSQRMSVQSLFQNAMNHATFFNVA